MESQAHNKRRSARARRPLCAAPPNFVFSKSFFPSCARRARAHAVSHSRRRPDHGVRFGPDSRAASAFMNIFSYVAPRQQAPGVRPLGESYGSSDFFVLERIACEESPSVALARGLTDGRPRISEACVEQSQRKKRSRDSATSGSTGPRAAGPVPRTLSPPKSSRGVARAALTRRQAARGVRCAHSSDATADRLAQACAMPRPQQPLR